MKPGARNGIQPVGNFTAVRASFFAVERSSASQRLRIPLAFQCAVAGAAARELLGRSLDGGSVAFLSNTKLSYSSSMARWQCQSHGNLSSTTSMTRITNGLCNCCIHCCWDRFCDCYIYCPRDRCGNCIRHRTLHRISCSLLNPFLCLSSSQSLPRWPI